MGALFSIAFLGIVQKGKLNDHLDTMIYQRFQELVTTRKKVIHPNMLPPTSAATKYHSLRVFHQVQQWQGNTLPAEDWGWELSEGRLKPVNSDFGPAHQSLTGYREMNLWDTSLWMPPTGNAVFVCLFWMHTHLSNHVE